MLCQAREMNSHVQQLQLATWQVGAKGLVGHLSNPLYCTWILEMYHIRGQNSHYKKLVWNERIKEGSKNAPKANLTPRCPVAYVIFENVLKVGINIACKAYFAVRSIWTFDWPRVGASQKVIPRERLRAPPHWVARWKKKEKKTSGLGLIRPAVPCRRKWSITDTNSSVWYSFCAIEGGKTHSIRAFFFWRET